VQEIGDRYDRLQSAAVEYLEKVKRYQWGAYLNGDLVTIAKLREVLRGGERVDLSRDIFSTTNELMDDLPRLQGFVEEFPRDLEVAATSFANRLGT
jgi:hypothetical protein